MTERVYEITIQDQHWKINQLWPIKIDIKKQLEVYVLIRRMWYNNEINEIKNMNKNNNNINKQMIEHDNCVFIYVIFYGEILTYTLLK